MQILLTSLLFLVFLFTGCAPKVSHKELSASIDSGNLNATITAMENDENSKSEMWYHLNMGRLYQNNGDYKKSIESFSHAESILTEYEDRAKVSMRNIGTGAGSLLFSKGAEKYYGKGYERSLMHTLNAFNFLLLGELESAAIEMKKMEKRQEFWLEESSAKIKEAADKQANATESVSAATVMEKYSMRNMLENPEIAAMINNYQDAFSYSLSSIIAMLNKDTSYAEVSARRAAQLSPDAERLLSSCPLTKTLIPHTEQEQSMISASLPPSKQEKKKKKSKQRETPPTMQASQDAPTSPVDVTIVTITGRGPSLKVENIPIPIGHLNYTTIDLPSLNPAVDNANFILVNCSSRAEPAYRLLKTEQMAYKTLKDEMPIEIASAVVRAVSKGAMSYAATKAGGDLGGLAASIAMHITSAQMELSFRNWELIPNSGYISSFTCDRSDSLSINVYGTDHSINAHCKAPQGVIIFITALSNESTKVNYATY